MENADADDDDDDDDDDGEGEGGGATIVGQKRKVAQVTATNENDVENHAVNYREVKTRSGIRKVYDEPKKAAAKLSAAAASYQVGVVGRSRSYPP